MRPHSRSNSCRSPRKNPPMVWSGSRASSVFWLMPWGEMLPAPCVPPSQVSPVTGSLHEHKTPAFTATGKSPGLKPGFLITAPDGSPSVITGDTMQHILFKTPRVIRRENGSSGHIFHLQVQSSTLFGKCQPQTIPDHANRLHPAKDAGGCGIYSFSLALRSFWRNW